MSLTEQYALDLYRAAQRGEPAPPAPGPHDWRTLRELREYRDFRAVTAGRPARRRGRHGGLTDALRSVRALGEVFARRRSAVPVRELPDLNDLPDPGEEGVGRGRDVVGRPLECG
ncbi:hypothetical protein D3C57_116415 [Streptomyces rapamycinicus NRRL 5491]|uniref:Uncharacterized protein n=1 Tax=Streptomyces rapamycinicus (strain ATCC 29253 / DSM 41530 / NRRL 5491 / AYB-994) TaxID=1343740 RepID=A0A3L8RJI1_STRRN|nr:hypothetical protein D3C57_116415 [Streptomyces rapamycinicus NRRL 5491]